MAGDANKRTPPPAFVQCPKFVYRGFNCLVRCRLLAGHDGRCE